MPRSNNVYEAEEKKSYLIADTSQQVSVTVLSYMLSNYFQRHVREHFLSLNIFFLFSCQYYAELLHITCSDTIQALCRPDTITEPLLIALHVKLSLFFFFFFLNSQEF